MSDHLEELRDRARHLFVPSQPISIQTALRGRDRQVDRTLENLRTPGRSVFIFGERGVGKTSLALTASHLFNSSEVEPLRLSCHRNSTFGEIVTQVVRKLATISSRLGVKTVTKEAKLKLGSVAEVLHRIEEKPNEHLARLDPNLAVDLFNAAIPPRLSGKLVLVLDELDTVASSETKSYLAFLLKQLGDRDCGLKFIFVGIAESVEQLLQEHQSASRYMATIKLERLLLGELRAIVDDGLRSLGIECNDPYSWRIAQISDGYAHFTHLLGLKLALRVINAGGPLVVSKELFAEAVQDAIEDSEGWLKHEYDQAVQKYHDVYEPVLWAAADDWQLARSTAQIFASFQRICADLERDAEDKREGFYRRLHNLRRIRPTSRVVDERLLMWPASAPTAPST